MDIITPCFRTWQDSTVIARIRKGRHLVTSHTQVLCSWVTEYLGTSRNHAAEKVMAPHSSTLAWKIPWTEEPGRLQSMGLLKSQTRLRDFTFTFHFHALEKEMATHSSVLVWRISGTGEPGGLPSMGLHRVRHDWSYLSSSSSSTWAVI